MPQNQSSNKFSSIIGIILLLGVIGFTVFINFFGEEPVEEIKEEAEIIEVTEPEFSILDSADLANLWKLEKLQTDSITISQNRKKMYVKIDKIVEMKQYNSLTESELNSLTEIKNTKDKFIMNYGMLIFKNVSYDNKKSKIVFEKVAGNALDMKVIRLMEIGRIISRYQIQSITTQSEAGDFTKVELKDGRLLFLIKQAF